MGLAVDPDTDRLFVSPSACVGEWSSASSPGGPELLDPNIGSGVLGHSAFIAVDHKHNRIYVTEDDTSSGHEDLIQVFELGPSHAHLGTLDGHATPSGKFLATNGWETIDVDEATGNLFVSELAAASEVFEFGSGLGTSEELLNTYKYSGFRSGGPFEMAVDNAPESPNYRSFYVPSAGSKVTNVFAFRFSEVSPPEVQSPAVTGITETEAVLHTTINPGGGETTYTVSYTAGSSCAGASVATEGKLPAGLAGVPLSAPLIGLEPGAPYRFCIRAENEVGQDQLEGAFRTYRAAPIGGPCPNQSLRSSSSAALPDCRAYELVTPPDTNGLAPLGSGTFGPYFPTLHAAPDGDKTSFRIEGGVIPGFEGAASTNGDNYLAARGSDGWSTELTSPGGTVAITPSPGGFSPDQGYSFWGGEIDPGKGIARNAFIRYPDGRSERVGRGSLGIDTQVQPDLIGPGGAHTIFATVGGEALQLEPEAPPPGTAAVYDRTIDPLTGAEGTHVVSLLPDDITPAAGENAGYVGASLDGRGVVFSIKGALYLRLNDETTYDVGEGVTFAGVSEGGGRVFYLQAGDLFAFDAASETAVPFSEGGETTPVNISGDGRTAYFVSPKVLTANPNPVGDHPEAGEENLYFSREGQISFLATVDPADVEEHFGAGMLGLGEWIASLQRPVLETSRTIPDGHAFLFESRAPLTGYETDGHVEVYRYDHTAGTLACLSCNPTGAAATSNAGLQTIPGKPEQAPVGLFDRIPNLRPDGNRAFFQSYEALVPSDTDNRQDVYEWEAQGIGSCTEAGGCTYLISSPHSARDEHLFALSEQGEDVFFLSGDLLLPSDRETTPSIYDARVEGGFAEAGAGAPCQGEGCRGELSPPPPLPVPTSPAREKGGNVSPNCPKGWHRVRRNGSLRCIKKHRSRHNHGHHRHGAEGNGSGSK